MLEHMMELNADNIANLTQYLIREYYKLNTEPLFSVLAEDCVWLGPGNLLVFGAEEIKTQFKNGFIMPAFQMVNPHFYILETGSESHIVVLGEYLLFSDENADLICASKQRITFCYRLEHDAYRLYHMHVSNEWNELKEDELFPFEISTQTYHYVKKLLKETNDRKNKVIIQTPKSTYGIRSDSIIYIEAADKYSILHTVHQNIVIHKSIGYLASVLPDFFCRIHTSYLINCHHVSKVERYYVTLVTGETLPIPEKRYTEVYHNVMQAMQ